MKPIPITEINGKALYYIFIAGANKIIDNQVFLNKINVFPVKDGDTGTNMASTVRSVLETLKPEKSYKNMLELIANAALVNARGNSGIIFAQFIYGVNAETIQSEKISLHSFVESIYKSTEYVYKAVATPIEGTMLTIIKAWASFIYHNKNKFRDFNELLLHSKAILEKTLAETTSHLKVLQNAKVVDAGANAFYFFIEGILEFIHHKDVRKLMQNKPEEYTYHPLEEQITEEISYRYCTEAIIQKLSIDQNELSTILQDEGDSVVVAGGNKTTRLHVHTNRPDLLFERLKDFGTISFQKADDMLRQSETVYKRKWKIALVTDSACDLPQEIIDFYQIHVVPINIFFGENHYLDKITIKTEQFYKQLDEKGVYPKTAQINEIAFRNLYSHLASHYDQIIAIHLTGKFSGTFFNSKKAAEKVSSQFNKPIVVFDSKNLSGALGLIANRIGQSIESGAAFQSIVEQTTQWIENTEIFVSVKTLKYMVKGGRVSPFKGMIARVLNLNPIVSMDKEGNSMIFGKTYHQSFTMRKIIKHVKELSTGKVIWNYIVMHANNPDAAEWYASQMQVFTNKEPLGIVDISPVIGANAGIGAASIAIMFK